MKKLLSVSLVLLFFFQLLGCSSYETYGDKKEKERNAIAGYIRDNDINVISESQFKQQDSTTNVERNEYVYLEKTGIYMQIVRKGCGSKLEDKKTVDILCRYEEYNILKDTVQLSNELAPRAVSLDKMSVTRNGSTLTGSFVRGLMMSAYATSSVPNAFLVPLNYVNIGRPQKEGDETAKIIMIVPHTQGQSNAMQNVYPCRYILTLEREY